MGLKGPKTPKPAHCRGCGELLGKTPPVRIGGKRYHAECRPEPRSRQRWDHDERRWEAA